MRNFKQADQQWWLQEKAMLTSNKTIRPLGAKFKLQLNYKSYKLQKGNDSRNRRNYGELEGQNQCTFFW